MEKTGLRFGFVGFLALTIAACSVTANDESPSSKEDKGDDTNAVEDEQKPLAELAIADGHKLTFTEVGASQKASILVAESHSPEQPSALVRLDELKAPGVTARDVFFALSKNGTALPERIAMLEETIRGRAQGWGLEKITPSVPETTTPLSGGNKACENGSFVASTYGGILPTNDAWLDRHPDTEYSHYLYTYYGPNGLTQVSSPRYSFTLARYDIRQYRGKACFETIEGAGLPLHKYFHNGDDQWVNLDPLVAFHYRTPGSTTWKSATSMTVPVGQTKAIEWAWFGNDNQEWDWRVNVSRAQPQDYVDYMRSFLE
jgi:hypothetical protein